MRAGVASGAPARRPLRALLGAVLGAVGLLAGAPPGAAAPAPATAGDRAEQPCEPLAPRATLLVDLADVPLSAVARLVSCAAERNILFSPAALSERRVTVVSARPVDRQGLLALWRALLAGQGLVVERHGAYDLVRPSAR